MTDDSKKMDEEHHHGQKGTAGGKNKKVCTWCTVLSELAI